MTSRSYARSGLQGGQEPRISLVPSYVESTGDEAVALAEIAGLKLDPWQQMILRHSLGERADGKWAAFRVGLCIPRQNGKNLLLEVRELVECLLVAEFAGPRLVLHSAHQSDTAFEHFTRMENRIKDSPELLRRVKHRGSRCVGFMHANGKESISFDNGSRIVFAARTKGGRRGYTGDLLVFDEAMDFPEEAMGAVLPVVSAKTTAMYIPGPQMILTGSAVDQQKHDNGRVFAAMRRDGIAGEDDSLAYFEWSAPDDAPANLESALLANPAAGVRISVEHMELEQRAMPEREYRVERLGQGDWPDLSPDAGRVIPEAIWAACSDLGSRLGNSPTFAIDVDPDQAWATIAAAGERDDGLYHVGVVEHLRGTTWVVDRIAGLLREHDGSQLIVDPHSQAKALIIDLEDAEVYPVRVTAADYGEACAGFLHVVGDGRLRFMPPQPELDAAVAGARATGLGNLDAWKWSRKDSGVVITPLVAATLALWGARTQGAPTVWALSEMVGNPAPVPVSSSQPQPVTAGQRFIPLDQMPARRQSMFRP